MIFMVNEYETFNVMACFIFDCFSDVESTDTEVEILRPCLKDEEGNKILNGITITKAGKK